MAGPRETLRGGCCVGPVTGQATRSRDGRRPAAGISVSLAPPHGKRPKRPPSVAPSFPFACLSTRASLSCTLSSLLLPLSAERRARAFEFYRGSISRPAGNSPCGARTNTLADRTVRVREGKREKTKEAPKKPSRSRTKLAAAAERRRARHDSVSTPLFFSFFALATALRHPRARVIADLDVLRLRFSRIGGFSV